jgi:hypothetical protein
MKKPKTGPAQYRQGDVFIERIEKLPAKIAPLARVGGRVVLAHGVVTGHDHAIAAKNVKAYAPARAAKEGELFLEISGKSAALTHDEHSTITLPAGTYKVSRQREYSPEEIRRVQD